MLEMGESKGIQGKRQETMRRITRGRGGYTVKVGGGLVRK